MTGFTDGPGSGSPGEQYGGGAGIIGALAQVGGALYDSAQNRKAARENTDKTIAAQKAEAELAYQRSMQMWYEQNAYNSPQAQMARFRAAGLNSQMIYGQGSPGNAGAPPQYQPANLQYRYEAPAYGAAIGSLLPTLMAVGSWMQNMRLSEAELSRKSTDVERSRQLIDFLAQKNPKELESIENRLSLFPYQSQLQASVAEKARLGLWETGEEFKYKYGQDLFRQSGAPGTSDSIGGVRRLQFLEQAAKTKLAEAKSSWTDFNITDPQQIMMMVMQGVMGLAGQTLRLSTHRSPKVTHSVTEQMRGGRIRTRSRTYEGGKR